VASLTAPAESAARLPARERHDATVGGRAADARRGVSPVRVTITEDCDVLEGFRAEWTRLAPKGRTSTIFQTFEWNASCWRALRPGVSPLVIVARDGPRIVGIAPFKVGRTHLLGREQRVAELLGMPVSDYLDLIVEPLQPEIVRSLLEALVDPAVAWDILDLANVPAECGFLDEAERVLCDAGFPCWRKPVCDAPFHRFGDPERDRRLRSKESLRRHYNHFARRGRLEFRHLEGPEAAGHLDAFFDQHVRRRALTDIPSPFVDERARAFCREVVRSVAPTGRLRFSMLSFDDRPIAYHLGFEHDGRLLWYAPTFDVDHRKHSPGEVLLKFVIEDAIARNVGELDFGIGPEPYKYRFADEVRRTAGLLVFRRQGLHRAWRMREHARAFIRHSSTLTRLAKAIRS
jgi:CelD/BcsL family acetyltransferase involved in cellulose biosynthesis